MPETADFSVSTQSRHPAVNFGYDVKSHAYWPNYVRPSSWTLTLTSKSHLFVDPSSGIIPPPNAVMSARWTVTRADIGFRFSRNVAGPEALGVSVAVPSPGRYRIELVQTFVDRHQTSSFLDYSLRDLLVVSLGDSFASGEGNPDVPAVVDDSAQLLCKTTTLSMAMHKFKVWLEDGATKIRTAVNNKLEAIPLVGSVMAGVATGVGDLGGFVVSTAGDLVGFTVGAADTVSEGVEWVADEVFGVGDGAETHHPARWQEPSAHRSYRSGASLAASKIEKESETHADRVTFLSFARSGATMSHGLLDERVMNPSSGSPLPLDEWIGNRGQVQEAAESLRGRHVDALVITAGINDLKFSTQVTDSILWESGAKRTKRINEASEIVRNELPVQFEKLRLAVDRQLKPGIVLVTEYPVAVFEELIEGEPCGVLGTDVGAFNLDHNEAKAMGALGRELNAQLKALTEDSGWIFVSGIEAGLRGHGYCADDCFFVSAEESCLNQEDFEGTLHPNKKGHAVARDCIAAALEEHLFHPREAWLEPMLHMMLRT